jgi:DMSO/TMAO reductase YedYZ heme-binding membrane subunit
MSIKSYVYRPGLFSLRSSLAMLFLFFFLGMHYLVHGIAGIQCSCHGEIPIEVQKEGDIALSLVSVVSAMGFIVSLGHSP